MGHLRPASPTDTGKPVNPYRFVGKEGYYTDDETGLILLGARYYDPLIGRFITQDPIRDGLNWYAYAGNNPVNAIDPTGLYTYGDAASFYHKWWSSSGYMESKRSDEKSVVIKMADVRWRGKDPLQASSQFNETLEKAKSVGYYDSKTVSIDEKFLYSFPSNTPEAVIFGQCTLHLVGTFTFKKPSNWKFHGRLSLEDYYDFDFRLSDLARGSAGTAGVAVGNLLGWANPFMPKDYPIISDWLSVQAGTSNITQAGVSFGSYWTSLKNK